MKCTVCTHHFSKSMLKVHTKIYWKCSIWQCTNFQNLFFLSEILCQAKLSKCTCKMSQKRQGYIGYKSAQLNTNSPVSKNNLCTSTGGHRIIPIRISMKLCSQNKSCFLHMHKMQACTSIEVLEGRGREQLCRQKWAFFKNYCHSRKLETMVLLSAYPHQSPSMLVHFSCTIQTAYTCYFKSVSTCASYAKDVTIIRLIKKKKQPLRFTVPSDNNGIVFVSFQMHTGPEKDSAQI